MDIAYKAMSTDPANRYTDVDAFCHAIRDYQEHYESIQLSDQAASTLESAEKKKNYLDFSRALFGYEEAKLLWNENPVVDYGIERSRRSYVECALQNGDLELADGLLESQGDAHGDLRLRVNHAVHERAQRYRRMRLASVAVKVMAVAKAASTAFPPLDSMLRPA